MLSLGALFGQIFNKSRRIQADAARQALVDGLVERGAASLARAASLLGLTSIPILAEGGPALVGELRGVSLSVTIAQDREGDLMTRFSATHAQLSGSEGASGEPSLVVAVEPRGGALEALFRRGAPTLDAEFDAIFRVRTSDPLAMSAILDERVRRGLLDLGDRMPLFLDFRGGEATLDTSGVELDPDRLVHLIELLLHIVGQRPEGRGPYRR